MLRIYKGAAEPGSKKEKREKKRGARHQGSKGHPSECRMSLRSSKVSLTIIGVTNTLLSLFSRDIRGTKGKKWRKGIITSWGEEMNN